jgi:hypothetical protein
MLYEHEFTHAEAVRYCQIGINSYPALTTLCIIAIAVINSSSLFNGTVKLVLPSFLSLRDRESALLLSLSSTLFKVFEFMLLKNLFVPSFISLNAKNAKTCCEGK